MSTLFPVPCVDHLICPVCGEQLTPAAGSLRCSGGHSHDVAKQRYVDLLPPGHGLTRHTGDSREMVTARQRFLARGHFSALANELADTTLAFLDSSGRTPGRPCTVLDVGCGSGYYLGVLAERLRETFSPTTCLLGMDVSRDALRIAGRAVPRAVFFLNDVRHRICAADASVDVLWNVFAPRNPAEFARVTRPGGLAVIVTPTEAHLREVAEYAPVIGMAPDKRESVAAALAPHFVETGATSLEYGMSLSGTDLVDLLLMTPNARHLSAEALERVAEVPAARITAAFDVLRFERRGG